jgi:hypothetical protein
VDVDYDSSGLRYRDTFSAVRVGRAVTVSSWLPSKHSLQVKGAGAAPSAWTVLLQGSHDGVNWTTLLTHNSTDGSIVYPSDAIERPVRYLRVNVTALTLGSATAVNVYVASKA